MTILLRQKKKLTEYLDPKKNVEYEIYTFRQARQNTGESINAFLSRLCQLSATCEFGDVDKEIYPVHQSVFVARL